MDCQLSTSPLPAIWVLEMLAHSNQVDASLLLDLLEKYPQISDELGRNARELVSLRILESFLAQGAQSNSVSVTSCQKIGFDPSEPFIVHKRSSMAEGCNSYRGAFFSCILKKSKVVCQWGSNLSVEDNGNGITPGLEGSKTIG